MHRSDRSSSLARGISGPPAVVIGLDSITGLQTARILADRGVPVLGVVNDRKHWGARTNSCFDVVESPSFGEDLVGVLSELGRRMPGQAVLFPCTDPSVRTLSRHRTALAEHYLLPLAPHAVVALLMDKVSFARHATARGLPVPRTEELRSRSDAEAAAGRVDFPCVLKPSGKSEGWLSHTSAKAFPVSGPDQLLTLYDQVRSWSPVLLVQEWVEGPETGLFSCNAYFDERGVPLVTFVARKVRQWPPGIGTSASGEECRNDEVLATTTRLFGELGYRGLAYLEMKRDVRSGRLVIIEPNVGRPTGRSAIAESGGVELVYTAYCDAAGMPLPPERRQKYIGTRWLDLRRDAQAVLVARRRGEISLREWAGWLRGPKAHAIWSRQDPAPFLVDLRRASATGIRNLLTSGSPKPPAESPPSGPAPIPAPATQLGPRL